MSSAKYLTTFEGVSCAREPLISMTSPVAKGTDWHQVAGTCSGTCPLQVRMSWCVLAKSVGYF